MISNKLMEEIHQNAVNHGWYNNGARDRNELEILIISEVAEALECFRRGEIETTIEDDGKPVGLPSEIADIVIRAADAKKAAEYGRVNVDFTQKKLTHMLLSIVMATIQGQPSDVIVKCYRLAKHHNIDLDAEIKRKHEYNKTRSYRHGNKAC